MAKDTAKYWGAKGRLLKKVYMHNGIQKEVAHWYIRPTIHGQRNWIPLGTENRAQAAQRAALLYVQVRDNGWGSLRPDEPVEKKSEVTIGDLLDTAKRLLTVKDEGFVKYRSVVRQVAKAIQKLPEGRNSGAFFRALSLEIDKLPVSIFTRESIDGWKVRAQRNKPPTTINSMLRGCKAIFRENVCASLGIENPFAKIKLEKTSGAALKYKSEFDLTSLIRSITADYARDRNLIDVYKILILLAATGARKNEIDKLEWRHLDLVNGTITFVGSHLKNDSSAATIPLASFAIEPLRNFNFPRHGSSYVLGPRTGTDPYFHRHLFVLAGRWLKSYEENGVRPFASIQKPLHTIRKEVGSILYQQTRDIYAVQQYLRHSNVKMTIGYYVDGGQRVAPKIEI